jgi:flagellum-specific peptidoglycan hydrolase FlgJ
MTTQQYIDANKSIAIDEAIKSGVPASITMAQGIIESMNGNSYLATIANNNFGIKCHNDWTGDHVYADDDKPHECFRKYNSVADSFADHIKFLQSNSRYKPLFNLAMDDYTGWANGLHNGGYATDPGYAQKLISTINQYGLQALDRTAKLRKIKNIILVPLAVLILAVILTITIIEYRKYKQQLIAA